MKFGETIYQRSVPKWAAYNLNYNELKSLIKSHTTGGSAVPVAIPGTSRDRWEHLEREFFDVLQGQYGNIALFLRSKYGEIERRLSYLERQVCAAQKSLSANSNRPMLQARRYQRLVQEVDSVGEDIQALTRFAATQKTAFRKILKKYKKRTGSTSLQTRVESEIFNTGQLNVDTTKLMYYLSKLTTIISNELEGPMLRREPRQAQKSVLPNSESPVAQITRAARTSNLHFDAALASVPFGEAAGTATYWVHPDNLEEARVLLLKYTRDLKIAPDEQTSESSDSGSLEARSNEDAHCHRQTVALLDNLQRHVQDVNVARPTRVSMSARWDHTDEAVVSMSDMRSRDPQYSTIKVKRKDLRLALDRSQTQEGNKSSENAASVRTVKDYLSEHRDFKYLAQIRSQRSRYAGTTNSSEVGVWAILDTEIELSAMDIRQMGIHEDERETGEAFIHAVLQIRWEFGPRPEVCRAFDTSHLAEKVHDFSLEGAAIHSQFPKLTHPTWTELLKQDIRKVPLARLRGKKRSMELSASYHSGPSSTASNGPADSIFSTLGKNSNTGSEISLVTSPHDASSSVVTKSDSPERTRRKKKVARIVAEDPKRQAPRYYSEYDDPNSELYQEEVYTIYVDPDRGFPGSDVFKKVAGWFNRPGKVSTSGEDSNSEYDPLLTSKKRMSTSAEIASSDESDSDPTITAHSVPRYKGLQGHVRPAQRYRQRLSRRQRAFERTLTQFYGGLFALSYIFLAMSGIILLSGRKKHLLEVDVGAVVGVVAAFVCTILSVVLVFMRKSKLSRLEKTLVVIGVTGTVLFGLAVIFGIVHRATAMKR